MRLSDDWDFDGDDDEAYNEAFTLGYTSDFFRLTKLTLRLP